MADDGAVAVAEAPVESTPEIDAGESTQSTDKPETQEKQDGRNQTDRLKKEMSELRRRAEAISDPIEKKAELERIKYLYDKSGKGEGYEKVYPTVREAREVKTLVDSFGGREGLVQAQQTLSRVQEVDQQLEAGNPAAAEAMWKEAPQGMIKLAPMIFSELEKNAPQEYAKAVVPHAVKFFDSAGFPEAFDKMVELYSAGNKAEADTLAQKLARWFVAQRSNTQQVKQADPEVERLRSELEKKNSTESQQAIDRAYGDVVNHAGPVIDKYLKPIVQKLGLTKEQYADLREDTWSHLQKTRNVDDTYKTAVAGKQRQGMDAVTAYIKSETEARANEAARAMATRRYGHQLKNGAVTKVNPTANPVLPGITRGKEPSPAEIDYGPKGIQAAKKQGFKDLGDMILAGKAPLKAGGIRQWR